MATPDTRSSLVLVKEFTFRGALKRWSNRYHFTGPETATLAEFEVLADAVAADEAPCYSGAVTIVEAIWYDASTATSTNPHGLATHTKTLAIAGTLDAADGFRMPGEVAVVLRMRTDARSTKNHPIYLFKYFHDAFRWREGNADEIMPGQVTALNELGDDCVAGWSDGTNTRVVCGPHGAVAQDRTTLAGLRHRDFPG